MAFTHFPPRASKLKHLPVTQGRHTSPELKAKGQAHQACTGPSSKQGHFLALESGRVLRVAGSSESQPLPWTFLHAVFQVDWSQGTCVLVPCSLEQVTFLECFNTNCSTRCQCHMPQGHRSLSCSVLVLGTGATTSLCRYPGSKEAPGPPYSLDPTSWPTV